jgi:hypothetical protein
MSYDYGFDLDTFVSDVEAKENESGAWFNQPLTDTPKLASDIDAEKDEEMQVLWEELKMYSS